MYTKLPTKYCYQHASSWLSGTTVHQSANTLNLGIEPWVMTPLPPWPCPCPWFLVLSRNSSCSSVFFFIPCCPSILGEGGTTTLKGGPSRTPSQSPNPQCPQQRGTLSGTSFSATLRPGWALANPRLSKSRGSLLPTPGLSPVLPCVLSWTGLVASCCNCPGLAGVCVLSGRLSGYPPVCLLSNARCPLPHCPPIHSTHPPKSSRLSPSHHTSHHINESTRQACTCSCSCSTSRLVLTPNSHTRPPSPCPATFSSGPAARVTRDKSAQTRRNWTICITVRPWSHRHMSVPFQRPRSPYPESTLPLPHSANEA